MINTSKQAGAEHGQAQIELGLGFTSIMICCIELIYKRFYWLVCHQSLLSTSSQNQQLHSTISQYDNPKDPKSLQTTT